MPASGMFVSFELTLLGVARDPEVVLILRVFKVLKSYLDKVQYCTSLGWFSGIEYWFWIGRVLRLDEV